MYHLTGENVARILIAVDGSSHSARVAKGGYPASGGVQAAAGIALIYVHLPVSTLGGLIKPIGHEALQRYYREEGEDALRGAKNCSIAPGWLVPRTSWWGRSRRVWRARQGS